MSKSKSIYCGSGKQQTDSWIKATINPDVISKFIQEYQGKRFVKININLRQEPNQFGKDVEITIDTYKFKADSSDDAEPASGRVESPYIAPEDTDGDDLPF